MNANKIKQQRKEETEKDKEKKGWKWDSYG